MSRRFQFSLGRLMISLSAVCVGAAIFVGSGRSGDVWFGCALLLDVLIVGATIGLLLDERPGRGAFRGACWAICFLVVVVPVAFFVGSYYVWQSIGRSYMEAADWGDKEEAALFRAPRTINADDLPQTTSSSDDLP